ncbi:MAG TPA: 3-deoxy-7-phosphoheptulonate synthase [Bacillota bacterium]|jgi:3-deoxy-7-phosphoheptulonate synthase|nr:3-deoxy-7-phosphoheptulonate synthase [Bacillota bacterium]HOL09090.1 3-deoxy-7-phosphoheptulonate synthase [Bacillota bacterium]HPO98032.1 3-deoxy-7-phosphoheptulonate synthase [Bacillota bacterium]
MIIVTNSGITKEQWNNIWEKLESWGFQLHVIQGVEKKVIGAVGDKRKVDFHFLENIPGVEKVIPILSPYKLAAKDVKPEGTIIEIGNLKIGGGHFGLIAGPCAVESEEQLIQIARGLKDAGANGLRGGAFKPRTSPYSFQGLEKEGLLLLAKAREETGLPVITELMNLTELDLLVEYADIIQIGARNMQNFGLLKAVGRQPKPVLLKRGLAATIEEWIMAAEYIIAEGNEKVILCERGIRTFETATRNTLDLSAIPLVKSLTHLPVVVDPSHGTGKRKLVIPMAKAAIVAGADGLLIEAHPDPANAWSDGEQSLDLAEFKILVEQIQPLLELENKRL